MVFLAVHMLAQDQVQGSFYPDIMEHNCSIGGTTKRVVIGLELERKEVPHAMGVQLAITFNSTDD